MFLLKNISRRFIYFLCLTPFIIASACNTTVGVFEKNIAIPDYSWSTRFKPEVTFEIQDTTAFYAVYIVLRHTDAYRYNNIWINIETVAPDATTTNQPLDLTLATDSKGWLASGMDDIFEHRIPIIPPQKAQRLKAGAYHFKLENIMREDPLEHIMNVGIRLEKVR
jgi:gliding motility-associated lipoprotein GldH